MFLLPISNRVLIWFDPVSAVICRDDDDDSRFPGSGWRPKTFGNAKKFSEPPQTSESPVGARTPPAGPFRPARAGPRCPNAGRGEAENVLTGSRRSKRR